MKISPLFIVNSQFIRIFAEEIVKNKTMVHTTLIPSQTVVELALPSHYVGKKVEFLIYISDEIESFKQMKPTNASQFKGILNAEEAKSFNQYLTAVRQEWDRNT
jgi:hypothetical protein